jgi:hypothetical protein
MHSITYVTVLHTISACVREKVHSLMGDVGVYLRLYMW